MHQKRWVVGNWKMNLGLAEAEVLAGAIAQASEALPAVEVVIAPSTPFLIPIKEKLKFTSKNFGLATQFVSAWPKGAYTGDVSAVQLKGIVTYAIIGHSERRKLHHAAEIVHDQVRQALENGLTPIICFGEPTRSASFSPSILTDLKRDLADLRKEELEKCIFAYEPLWAIGTGDAATPAYITKVVSRVREWFTVTYDLTMPILYGGSVTADNAQELADVKEIAGVLVGGASLNITSFTDICRAFAGQLE